MKRLFSLILLMTVCLAGFSQREIGLVSFQPKIGFNMSDFTDAPDAKSKIGFVAGAEFEYQITEVISVSAGALYSMQGAKAFGYSNGMYVKADAKLAYINIPVMVNAYLTHGLALKFGIQPGFNIQSDLSGTADGISVQTEVDGIRSFDLSIPVGLSYEFRNFVLDGRYNIGVTSIEKNSDARHSVFQITLGYRFRI